MSKNSRIPIWIRGSRIEEIVWIGKNVLAWCSGSFIVFYDVTKREETLRWCNDQSTGDGACCLASHSNVSIFAYSEKTSNPRILIYAYPSMKKISECTKGCQSGYLACAFTSHDYIVSIGSYHQFPLIIWSWRTGEKIVTANTAIRDSVGQLLKITQSERTILAQMGKTCGRLFTWEIDVIAGVVLLKDHEVKLPKKAVPYWIDWRHGQNPILAITDSDGHIYLSDYDGHNVYRIVTTQHCGVCINYELPAIACFRNGIVLRTTYCQVQFFAHNPKANRWQKVWYVKSTNRPCLLVVHPFKTDRLFYHTFEGNLMEMIFHEDIDKPALQSILMYGGVYKYFDFVNPCCHHIVTISDSKQFTVMECCCGISVAELDLDTRGDVLNLASHPEQPLIAITTSEGEFILIRITDPERPKILWKIKLFDGKLDFIKFSHSGKYLITSEKNTGICFCLSVLHDKLFDVIAQIKTKNFTLDTILIEDSKSLYIFVLHALNRYSVGNKLSVYNITDNNHWLEEPLKIVKLHTTFRNFCHLPGSFNIFVGSTGTSHQLHVMEFQSVNNIAIINYYNSRHQVRSVNTYSNRKWILTYGADGLVIVRDSSLTSNAEIVAMHHSFDFGVKRAIIDLKGDRIISLGSNGSLVAMARVKLQSTLQLLDDAVYENSNVSNMYQVDYKIYQGSKYDILADYSNVREIIHPLLTEEKHELAFPKDLNGNTWVEWKQKEEVQKLNKRFAHEKMALKQEFENLKITVRELLNANYESPENERLPVSIFDLDKVFREKKIITSQQDCDIAQLNFENECLAKDKLAHWIKVNFWDPLIVLGQSIFTISAATEITNYAAYPDNQYELNQLWWAEFNSSSLQQILENDTFKSWNFYTKGELDSELQKEILVQHDRKTMIDFSFEEEDKIISEDEFSERIAHAGTISQLYIEPSSHYYAPMETYGFTQILHNNSILKDDAKKLRQYFNERFCEIMETKENVLKSLHEKNIKLTHIRNELSNMFGIHLFKTPVDYKWRIREKPENIITVHDDEINSLPYISPSQQLILNQEAAEAERIRQLLLADDFRDRALMSMMDGVLELRWEDLIKKDVPLPHCMLIKKPEEYNAQDIITVKQYEKDVENLNEERYRYRRILENDWLKIQDARREEINNFNISFVEFLMLKINIETNLRQIDLQYVRGNLHNFQRNDALKVYHELKQQIGRKMKDTSVLESQMNALEHVYSKLRLRYENLRNHEKATNRRLLSEFQSLGKNVSSQLEDLFKRRPNVALRVGYSNLDDLGKYVLSRNHPTHLPSACEEYLNELDSFDEMPLEPIEFVEPRHWRHFCHIRRQKIAVELITKSQAVRLAETERRIKDFNSKISRAKKITQELENKLMDMKEARIAHDLNTEIQLILKMGQIEINLRGNLKDSTDAILLPRSIIGKVNDLVLKEGKKKLDDLFRIVNFNRQIVSKEVQHGRMKSIMKNLSEELHDVKNFKVTYEMRNLLKNKNFESEKTTYDMETRLRTLRKYFKEVLQGWAARLVKVRGEISSVERCNLVLDRMIAEMNVARCEMELQRDFIGEARQREYTERKMRVVMRRSNLIKKLQDNYAELLALRAEHELLRLRRYPTHGFHVDKR